MVLGDFVADEYLFGLTSRVSREAPVLVLRYASKEIGLGGAGNAVNNLIALGAQVTPVGVVGDDEMGRKLISLLKHHKVDTRFMFIEKGRDTTTKTRVLAGGPHTTQQQVIRIDRGEYDRYVRFIEERILKVLDEKIDQVEALLISDYQYGVLTPRVIEKVNAIAKRKRIVITVDSRYRMLQYKGVTALTPNEPEVEEALAIKLDGSDEMIRSTGERILKKVSSQAVLITRGSKGMGLIRSDQKAQFIPVFGNDEVADVTGAGDTVIAILTLALSAGGSLLEAAYLANIGGGLVVMKQRAATVSREEMAQALKRS